MRILDYLFCQILIHLVFLYSLMRDKLLRQLASLKKSLNDSSLGNAFDEIKDKILNLPEQEKGHHDFPVPMHMLGVENAFVIYSDGACRGNPGPGAFGCMAQDSNANLLFEYAETRDLTTNNQMELQGVITGLKKLKNYLEENKISFFYSKITVITDSKYVVDGITKWIHGWKKRGWKKADNKAPENLDYWKELDGLSCEISNINYEWVKGHAGHPQNERCDQLANKALDHEGF